MAKPLPATLAGTYALEIRRAVNGWIIKPPYDYARNGAFDFAECVIATTPAELAAAVATWAESQRPEPGPARPLIVREPFDPNQVEARQRDYHRTELIHGIDSEADSPNLNRRLAAIRDPDELDEEDLEDLDDEDDDLDQVDDPEPQSAPFD